MSGILQIDVMWYSHEKLRGMIYVQAFSGESGCTTAFSVHLMIAFLIVAIFSCIPEHSPELVCARVLDGDTIEITDGIRVRYIGINTPEVDEPWGDKATEANKGLVEGKQIRLEYDVETKDRYDRTLAYVYADDTFVNAELVRLGLAEVQSFILCGHALRSSTVEQSR